MDELVTWLRAQLDDDERKVAAMEREETRVRTAPIFQGHPPDWLAGVDIFVSSTRWRAEVDTKRALLEETIRPYIGAETTIGRVAVVALRLLALPYAGQPGYREEWRP